MKIPIPFTSRSLVLRIEANHGKPLRPRFSIRGLMISIALMAIVLGVLARQRAEARRQALRTQILAQLARDISKMRLDALRAAGLRPPMLSEAPLAPPAIPR